MKTITGNLIGIILFALAIYFYMLTLTIIAILLVLLIIGGYENIKRERRLKKFKVKCEGNYFILYSSNKRLKGIIEKELMPIFKFDYTVIYNNRNTIESDIHKDITNYLQIQSSGLKFPILYRIEKEGVQSRSFYEEVNELKQEYISKDVFNTKVNNKLNKLKL